MQAPLGKALQLSERDLFSASDFVCEFRKDTSQLSVSVSISSFPPDLLCLNSKLFQARTISYHVFVSCPAKCFILFTWAYRCRHNTNSIYLFIILSQKGKRGLYYAKHFAYTEEKESLCLLTLLCKPVIPNKLVPLYMFWGLFFM